jgi:hypothetical protein
MRTFKLYLEDCQTLEHIASHALISHRLDIGVIDDILFGTEEQEEIIQKRPDLIGQIRNLDPKLKSKYKDILALSKIDI